MFRRAAIPLVDLKVDLRDIRRPLVKAWEAHFEGISQVRVQHGDIFDDEADAIVSPANSFGFMDGGIDLVYSKYFGWDVQKRLQETIRADFDGELPVGEAVIIPTRDQIWPYLISAPTMRVPMNVAQTPNAYLAFRAVLRAVKAHNEGKGPPIRRLLCPGLGTAVGQMPAETCARQMRAAYDAVVLGKTPQFPSLHDAKLWHIQMLRDDF